MAEAESTESNKVEEGAAKAPAPVTQVGQLTTAVPAPEGPSFGERAGRFFRRLLRWVLILAVVAGLGYGAWVGWPILRDRVIAPVEANIADMGVVQDRLDAGDARLAGLEADIEALAATQQELAASQAALGETVAVLEAEIEASGARIAALDALTAELEEGVSAGSAETARQVAILKSMELMGRARLFLYQSNFGLAEQDVQAARAVLLAAVAGATVEEQEVLQGTVERLDRVLGALPAFPVRAADDLDIAWQILIGQIPAVAEPPAEPSAGDQVTTTTAP